MSKSRPVLAWELIEISVRLLGTTLLNVTHLRTIKNVKSNKTTLMITNS